MWKNMEHGRSLRDTWNSITVLRTEGTCQSIRITPTILIHIFQWVFFSHLQGFSVPHGYFHSPVHVSVISLWFLCCSWCSVPLQALRALQEGVPVRGEDLGLFHVEWTMLTLHASCSSGFARSLDLLKPHLSPTLIFFACISSWWKPTVTSLCSSCEELATWSEKC